MLSNNVTQILSFNFHHFSDFLIFPKLQKHGDATNWLTTLSTANDSKETNAIFDNIGPMVFVKMRNLLIRKTKLDKRRKSI